MTRHPAFWFAYAALAAMALAAAWKLFPLAIPLVNLDITMPRATALAQAEEIAAKRKLGPDGARSAVRFAHDGATQNYVELEGGGKAAFAALMTGDLYAPFWWEVRIFKPGEVGEATIRFKPDGATNGFSRRLPETYVRDGSTMALAPEAARALAEERAAAEWKFDLGPYTILEQSQQTRPTGRVDHAFVYQRAEALGEARVRLRLGVAGDELVEIAPYVHVPQKFERRFRELRSANDTIAGVASVSAGLLYGLGGCVLGVLWLARRHGLEVRPALAAGFVVGGLMAAMTLSASPAAWFAFDTAQATSVFWLRQAGRALVALVGGGLAYALVFMAGESLSRCAFAHQPQLWRVWSNGAGPTRAVLGRTLGGYLFVPLELALVAAFYFATNRWLGWWQPSEMLTDPEILSFAIPALMPIAVSLQAGFMEECLFRAIPLALGALIGARLGRRRTGIAVAFVVQAVVFGAAHANYPGFPPYSRLVELIVPSMIWAAIFLRYGLLTTILLHALFDLALFSIPLFLVDAPGAGMQRAAVVVAGLVPLAVILWHRARAGAWGELPSPLLNGGWTPRAAAAAPRPQAREVVASTFARLVQRSLPLLGIAGFAGWIAFTPMRSDVPPLVLDREQAEVLADAALKSRGIALGPEWRRLSTVSTVPEEDAWAQHKFVWREAGPEAYRSLVGPILAPPLWQVRYAMFEGDVASRAEEWRIAIGPSGELRQIRHVLPEARPGARLSRAEALPVAQAGVRDRFDADPAALDQVSVEERDRPARTDWSFTFADRRIDVGKGGEARMVVSVAGDEVVGAGRYVHVPEPWLRAERESDGRTQLAKMGGALLAVLAGLAAVVVGVQGWMRRHCDTGALAVVAATTMAGTLAGVAVMWPALIANLRTTEPVAYQLLLVLSGSLLAAMLGSLAAGLAAGVGAWAARSVPATPLAGGLAPWAAGVAAALAVEGVAATAGRLLPADEPTWPSLALESAAWPWAAAALEGLGVLSTIGAALFILHMLQRATAGWTRRTWLGALVVAALVAGLAAARGGGGGVAAVGGLVAGVVAATVVYSVLRFDPRTVPGYVVTAALAGAAENAALKGTLAGWAAFAVVAAVGVAVGVAATRYLARPLPPHATA